MTSALSKTEGVATQVSALIRGVLIDHPEEPSADQVVIAAVAVFEAPTAKEAEEYAQACQALDLEHFGPTLLAAEYDDEEDFWQVVVRVEALTRADFAAIGQRITAMADTKEQP